MEVNIQSNLIPQVLILSALSDQLKRLYLKTLKDLLAVDRNKMAKFNLKMEKFN